ncbi:hypothetical protein OCH239_04935 [Roseivivax halodurans JCM 10272]|uniref:Uncharacterized protein n=1 Tax=Roseivivax halodurans JCM 10272 TaxID=1449350 RepID=X7EDM8_9RHOB|nr:hypothetical protein [Roseivivax halodurans]ETX14199.1 hypothetical protein OCH239_04935 [Roseivivax halodurans JCM 10272]
MIAACIAGLRSFARKDDGSVTIPTVLWTAAFLGLLTSGVEIGIVTARETQLEQALDKTTRDVRLGTGTAYDRQSLKQRICEHATILPDCLETLQLEMVRLDIRDWQTPPREIQCKDMTIDATQSGSDGGPSDEVLPQVAFDYGRENELMMLRACFKYEPISPLTMFGANLQTDVDGYTNLVAKAAFVHEPL